MSVLPTERDITVGGDYEETIIEGTDPLDSRPQPETAPLEEVNSAGYPPEGTVMHSIIPA